MPPSDPLAAADSTCWHVFLITLQASLRLRLEERIGSLEQDRGHALPEVRVAIGRLFGEPPFAEPEHGTPPPVLPPPDFPTAVSAGKRGVGRPRKPSSLTPPDEPAT